MKAFIANSIIFTIDCGPLVFIGLIFLTPAILAVLFGQAIAAFVVYGVIAMVVIIVDGLPKLVKWAAKNATVRWL